MAQQRSGRTRAAANDLSKIAKDRKIRYFLISFVDLFGVLRAKLVPARAIGDMQKDGAGFAGFAAWLDMTPAHPDMFAIPDPTSLIQLPWKPEVGWVAGDLWMAGKEVEDSPRVTLKRQIERANKAGFLPKVGVHDGLHYAIACNGGSGIVMMSWLGRKAARNILGSANRRSAFEDLPFKTQPFYSGTPWFVPILGSWYRFRDWLDLRQIRSP